MRAIYFNSGLLICLWLAVKCEPNDWDYSNVRLFSDPSSAQSLNNGLKVASMRPPQMKIQFQSHGKKFTLDVMPNSRLLGQGVSPRESGQALVGTNMHVEEPDGTNNFIAAPFARFFVVGSPQGPDPMILGALEYNGSIYRLTEADHPTTNFEVHKKVKSMRQADQRLVLRRRIGQLSENGHGVKLKCGAERLGFNQQQAGTIADLRATNKSLRNQDQQSQPLRMSGKARAKAQKGISDGCPVNPHQLVVAVVADCNYVKAMGSTAKARTAILNEMNLVSGIFYRSYNIDITVDSVILLEKCTQEKGSFNVPCKDYPGLDAALNSFSKWRNGESEEAGVFHLVTSCDYSDTVGLAWVNQVCRTTSFTDSFGDTVSGTSISVLIPNHFSVIAHELAHNLGAIHDCGASNCNGQCTDYLQCQCCPCEGCDCKGNFIMKPEEGGLDATVFSSCTIKDVCDKLPYLGSCLKEQGLVQQDLIAVCGNGIKEGSEECDCGGWEACQGNPCCTADCKLKANATCSDSNELCCQDCQVVPAEAKQACRVGTSVCQKDTYCDGVDASCPMTQNNVDGTACNDNGDKCASGICTSRDTQCAIFGRHLNITEACPYTKRSCGIICNGDNQCVDMNANFLDGTPCGQKGYCMAGMCSEFGSSANSQGTIPGTCFPNDNSRIVVATPFLWLTPLFRGIISVVKYFSTLF